MKPEDELQKSWSECKKNDFITNEDFQILLSDRKYQKEQINLAEECYE